MVETLVAISIVLVGVAAASSSAQLGLHSNSGVRDRVTAMYIAQEALEAVKNKKDTNIQRNAGRQPSDPEINWLHGITFDEDSSDGTEDKCDPFCGYNILNDRFFSCPQNNNGNGNIHKCRVYITSAGIYRQKPGNGPPSANESYTGFFRKISVVETPGNSSEAMVKVIVTKPGSTLKPYEITSYIYNWF